MVKLTFTVDPETVEILKRTAARMNKPQSAIFREAIRDFADRADKLTAEERDKMLAVLDRIRTQKPTRPQHEVEAEIAGVRATRKTGGRRTRAE